VNPKVVPLLPFGARVELPPGTELEDLDIARLRAWVDEHRVVQLRGVASLPPHRLAGASRRLGPLQPWPFGAVHELRQVARTENYLYTAHAVPLHWDGAFAAAVPHWLVFHCVLAPGAGSGGETVFVDTTRVLARMTREDRAAIAHARFRYTTEKKAHYGGSFVSPVVARHPTLNLDVIRYAEPVHDLNPVRVEPEGDAADREEGERVMSLLGHALAASEATLALPWQEGDFVIADNHALLHGRRAFLDGAPRHLRRVNVLDPDRSLGAKLRASWRIRRPEFFSAEIAILLIPAFLAAPSLLSLASVAFAEAVLLFVLLVNLGDMINCWFDREVDLHRKTHLAEAIALLGRRAVALQIAASTLGAVILGAHLGWSLGRPWMIPAGLVGAVLGAGYTAPPLRLKSRGLLQLAAYIGLLFVGPMILISGVFLSFPTVAIVAAAVGFGAMQTGVLLVNTAEDLDEDEREGIRTVAVVLQARGTVRLARGLVAGGAGLLLASFATWAWWSLALAALPVVAVAWWNVRWLTALEGRMVTQDEAARRGAIRDQGKHVPWRLKLGAWACTAAAAAASLARLLAPHAGHGG
jgi:alpha-ketoglutarate-dependent taurine dioxygenase/1,4-dihydroxy-2-naphthoate octaprenyltransferase